MPQKTKSISPTELAQRITGLLESARFDTTYKLATLEAMIVLVGRKRTARNRLTASFSAREVSDLILERYWAQAIPYTGSTGKTIPHLRQKAAGEGDLISRVGSVRTRLGLTSRSDTLGKARTLDPRAVRDLENLAWRRAVTEPIPRLQRTGSSRTFREDRFIYDYAWRSTAPNRHLSLARLDDTITLKPGVAEGLMVLKPLLLSHIETLWLELVAGWNPHVTDAARVREALFDEPRSSTSSLRSPLLALQGGLCFYCGRNAGKNFEVDHFLPYSLSHNEAVENFVIACKPCNASKSASLPALKHVRRWRQRVDPETLTGRRLAALATKTSRPCRPSSTISEVWSAYKFAGPGKLLWSSNGKYELIDIPKALKIIG